MLIFTVVDAMKWRILKNNKFLYVMKDASNCLAHYVHCLAGSSTAVCVGLFIAILMKDQTTN